MIWYVPRPAMDLIRQSSTVSLQERVLAAAQVDPEAGHMQVMWDEAGTPRSEVVTAGAVRRAIDGELRRRAGSGFEEVGWTDQIRNEIVSWLGGNIIPTWRTAAVGGGLLGGLLLGIKLLR